MARMSTCNESKASRLLGISSSKPVHGSYHIMPPQNFVLAESYITLTSNAGPGSLVATLGAWEISQGVCCFACSARCGLHQALDALVCVPTPSLNTIPTL